MKINYQTKKRKKEYYKKRKNKDRRYCYRNLYQISVRVFGFISFFLSNRWFWVAVDGNSSQKYVVNTGVSQGPSFGLVLFLLYISDHPDDVISSISICADDTLVYSHCDHASNLWQQLELDSELEFYLWVTVI